MSDKMWAGRFSAETDKRVNDFNSSIRFDCRMYEEDITGSIVHARMLARPGRGLRSYRMTMEMVRLFL